MKSRSGCAQWNGHKGQKNLLRCSLIKKAFRTWPCTIYEFSKPEADGGSLFVVTSFEHRSEEIEGERGAAMWRQAASAPSLVFLTMVIIHASNEEEEEDDRQQLPPGSPSSSKAAGLTDGAA